MNLVEEIRKLLQTIRDAATDGKVTLREMVQIAVALGDLLRVIGELIPGMAHEAEAAAGQKE